MRKINMKLSMFTSVCINFYFKSPYLSINAANNFNLQIHRNLGMVERAVSATDAQKLENEVQTQIDHVISNCERLDILVMKEPPTRRANAKMRVNQLKYDCQHLQSSLRQLQHKRLFFNNVNF